MRGPVSCSTSNYIPDATYLVQVFPGFAIFTKAVAFSRRYSTSSPSVIFIHGHVVHIVGYS